MILVCLVLGGIFLYSRTVVFALLGIKYLRIGLRELLIIGFSLLSLKYSIFYIIESRLFEGMGSFLWDFILSFIF